MLLRKHVQEIKINDNIKKDNMMNKLYDTKENCEIECSNTDTTNNSNINIPYDDKKYKESKFVCDDRNISIINYIMDQIAQNLKPFHNTITTFMLQQYNLTNNCCIYNYIIVKSFDHYKLNSFIDNKNMEILYDNNINTNEYNPCILNKLHDCNNTKYGIVYILPTDHSLCGFLNKQTNILTIIDPNLSYTDGYDNHKKLYGDILNFFNNKLYIDYNKIAISNIPINKYTLYDPIEYLKDYDLLIFQSGSLSGSCQSWSLYIAFLMILNTHIPFKHILYYHQNIKNSYTYILPKFICYLKYLAKEYKMASRLYNIIFDTEYIFL